MVHKRKLRNAKQTKKSWQYKSNDSETERWRKINNQRRHQRHAETHNKKQTHRCQTFFFWLWFLCACAHAHGDQKRNSHFNSNAWIPFHKRPQFTQLIYIYRFGMLLVLLIYNIRSYVPFYSILCSLSFAHLIYALIWTRHKLNILDKRIEKINQSAAATENDHT